jgi:hypothetical protein
MLQQKCIHFYQRIRWQLPHLGKFRERFKIEGKKWDIQTSCSQVKTCESPLTHIFFMTALTYAYACWIDACEYTLRYVYRITRVCGYTMYNKWHLHHDTWLLQDSRSYVDNGKILVLPLKLIQFEILLLLCAIPQNKITHQLVTSTGYTIG